MINTVLPWCLCLFKKYNFWWDWFFDNTVHSLIQIFSNSSFTYFIWSFHQSLLPNSVEFLASKMQENI